MPTLATPRLVLRPFELADAPRAGRLSRDWDVARMVSSMPFPQPDIAVEGFILIEQARRPLERDHVFAIDLPGEGLIGVCGAHTHKHDYKGRDVEIGYWLGRPYWGNGYASEAAHALAAFAASLGHGPVVARHFIDNPASGQVLRKIGFAYTGETRPMFCLARGEEVETLFMERVQARRTQAA
jgi:RimJ/RimL family protein N-acetyltransferase